jgi:hypothetical protein
MLLPFMGVEYVPEPVVLSQSIGSLEFVVDVAVVVDVPVLAVMVRLTLVTTVFVTVVSKEEYDKAVVASTPAAMTIATAMRVKFLTGRLSKNRVQP